MSYVATSKIPTLENVPSIGARLIEKTGAISNHSPPLLPRPSSTTNLTKPDRTCNLLLSRSNTRSQESVAGTLPIATLSSPTNPTPPAPPRHNSPPHLDQHDLRSSPHPRSSTLHRTTPLPSSNHNHKSADRSRNPRVPRHPATRRDVREAAFRSMPIRTR